MMKHVHTFLYIDTETVDATLLVFATRDALVDHTIKWLGELYDEDDLEDSFFVKERDTNQRRLSEFSRGEKSQVVLRDHGIGDVYLSEDLLR